MPSIWPFNCSLAFIFKAVPARVQLIGSFIGEVLRKNTVCNSITCA
jgi:hypothetical protein